MPDLEPSIQVLQEFWSTCAELIRIFPDKPERFSGDTEAVRLVRTLKKMIATAAEELAPNEFWLGDAAVGKGNWARVPWVALFDTRETKSAQRGVYPVIHLSCESPQGLRIGLGVAATEFKGRLEEKAVEVRDQMSASSISNMGNLFNDATLGTEERIEIGSTNLAKGYSKGMVFERFFTLEELNQPSADLTKCFDVLMNSYKEWVDQTHANARPLNMTPSEFEPFLETMQRYADDGVVFLSSSRQAKYFVSEVNDDSCAIQRLDAEEHVTLTASGYQNKLEKVTSQGGRIARTGLDSTVAIHIGYAQGSQLGLTADRESIVLFRDLNAAAQNLVELIKSISSPQLYKPAVLALVVEAIRDGNLKENRFEFDWLLPRFVERMTQSGRDVGEQQLAEGFGRLTSDLFWMLAYANPHETLSADKPTPSQIRKLVTHALLKEPYWQVITNPKFQIATLNAIYQKWPELSLDRTEAKPNVEVTKLKLDEAAEILVKDIEASGFIYQPWQIASYITALRTKPFVILAGVSGTGKSKLPFLVSKFAGSVLPRRIAVRPDWTDSSEVIGYVDLQNTFRPGVVLQEMLAASNDNRRHHVCLIDEMNLARVEHYFAEILSAIEDRRLSPLGGFDSSAIITQTLPDEFAEWQDQHIPGNLGIVGTVNMDESSHGFSRKVLDRAFTIELSEIELDWQPRGSNDLSMSNDSANPKSWPREYWNCRASRLAELESGKYEDEIRAVVEMLKLVNQTLQISQLQVGYRVRDEIALFLINAKDIESVFRTNDGSEVDPLDLALMMKVLPRIAGGSNSIRRTLLGLLSIAKSGILTSSETEPTELLSNWEQDGRPAEYRDAKFPRTTARLCLMWDRLESEGYTSFWL